MRGATAIVLTLGLWAVAPAAAAAQWLDIATRIVSPAQAKRHELGGRLRRLDRAWLACDDAGRKRAAIAGVNRAVRRFFASDPAAIARAMDDTTRLLSGMPAESGRVWADAIDITATPAIVGVDTPATVTLRVTRAYRPDLAKGAVEPGLILRFGATETRLDRFPVTVADHPIFRREGDFDLPVQIVAAGTESAAKPLRTSTIRVSAIADAKSRTARLAVASGSAAATRRWTVGLLAGLAAGQRFETDYPAAAILAAAGTPADAATTPTGDLYLAVARGLIDLPVRAYRPPADSDTLVVALHGAGGSENFFFEAYGDGLAARLCRQRGWALMAPRVLTPFDDFWGTVDALKPTVAPGAKRVFVIGHSLGAISAVAMAGAAPARLSGVAAISVGGRPDADALSDVPFFVAAGTRDFGRAGAMRLAKALKTAGGEVTYREYAAEHLMVVPESLPDIFRWMDAQPAR